MAKMVTKTYRKDDGTEETVTVTEYDAAIRYLNWHAKNGLARTCVWSNASGNFRTTHITGSFGTLCNENRYDTVWTMVTRPTCQRCIHIAASF